MYVCMCVLQEFLKSVRRQYLQAHEQIFFPLNIEVQKAETRVMTYLARDEIRCDSPPPSACHAVHTYIFMAWSDCFV